MALPSTCVAIAMISALSSLSCSKPDGVRDRIAPPTVEVFIKLPDPRGKVVVAHLAEAKRKLGDAFVPQVSFGGDERPGYAPALCAMKQAPDRFLDMIQCQLKDEQVPSADSWRACAKHAGIDDARLSACADGPEGKKLVATSLERAKVKRFDSNDHAVFINGQWYMGPTKTRDFLVVLCLMHQRHPPDACKNQPKPPKFDAIIIADARCTECGNMRELEETLKRELPGVVLKRLDYSSAEGKALYETLSKSEKVKLPIMLMGKEVMADVEGYDEIKQHLSPLGDYLAVKYRGGFDPTAEICDNKVDDVDHDGLVDCADPECAQAPSCKQP